MTFDADALEKYRKAGNITGRAREYGASLLAPGVKIIDVAIAVEEFIRKEGGEPAFPCCMSMNEDAAHDTPAPGDDRVLNEGDLVKLDCGVQVDGYIGDTAITVEVGTSRRQHLIAAARQALDAALDTARAGVEIRAIGAAVENTVKGLDLRPVANLTGHSLERYHQHAGLSIPNVAAGTGTLEAGTAVAIEPFVTDGVGKVRDTIGGNIYHLQAGRPPRDPVARKALQYISEHHAKLPFAGRWVESAVDARKLPYALRTLERNGNLHHYPVLREAGDGWVAQMEHTVLILEDGIEITTRV